MIQLAEIFQDGMILQRRKPICIWGNNTCTQNIVISINDIKYVETEIVEGNFSVQLPAQEAIENATFKLCGNSGDEIFINRVDIGEVWIAGGQSNMEFNLRFDKEGDAVINAADDEHFRFYDVGKYAFEGEKEERLKPNRIYWDKWLQFCPKNAPGFSAVGTYFAMRIREELKIPVGIIGCNWGGTTASAWLEEKLIRDDPELKVYIDAYNNDIRKLNMEKYIVKNRRSRQQMSSDKIMKQSDVQLKVEANKASSFLVGFIANMYNSFNKMGPNSENRPGGLYQTMLKKIAGFSCQGVLWYQGESDDIYANVYGKLLTKMIDCWRKDWKEEIPFLLVQLAPFETWLGCSGTNYPLLRQQQQNVEDTVSKTWLTSIMDVGSRYDIHPKEKQPVGHRLALLALDKIYNMEFESQSPRIKQITKNGNEIVIKFQYLVGGLVIKQYDDVFSELENLFEVEKAGKKLRFEAKIQDVSVILHGTEFGFNGNLTVSFAYQPYCKVNLYSKSGLPVRPFKEIING